MAIGKLGVRLVVLLSFVAVVGLAFGASRPAAEMQEQERDALEQEFREERERFEAVRRSFKAGPVNDLKAYERFAEEIQARWRHRDKEYYARVIYELCGPLSSGRLNSKRQYEVARKYALEALAHRDAIPLTLELELTGFVMTDMFTGMYEQRGPHGDEFAQRRRKDVEIRLHAWKRLVDAIDPEWDPDAELMQDKGVMPPPGVKTWVVGMDPPVIEDPGLRAQYEEAVQRNREKNAKWAEQYELHKWLKWYPQRVEDYLISVYSMPPHALKELNDYLDRYVTDKMSKTRIVETVKANMRERKE